jgi:hypothetical protein
MTDLNFNNAGPQRSFDVIPENTTCVLQMNIRPGGAGDGGWLTRSADGNSEGLDCEFVVVGGDYDQRKVWQRLTLQGTTPGHAEAAKISRNLLRAILESAKGIKPGDTSEAAQAARSVGGWSDFEALRFIARLGVRPPQNGYAAKNTILEVITPERQVWRQPEQLTVARPTGSSAPGAEAKPANTIARPKWAD